MKEALGRLIELVYAATKTAKVRKRLMGIVAALVILQLYFVRELIAAELLFGIGFSVILVLAGILYLVGAIAEQGWDLTEAGARVIARSARRSYSKLSPVIGALAERGWDLTEAGARVIARSARRSYNKLSPIIGALTVQGWELAEARTRAITRSAHRSYSKLSPVIGALTVQGWELAEARTRAFARSARRGYNKLEEVSKRQFRHPRSESAR